MKLRDALRGYAYIAPNFLGFLVFTAFPVAAVAIMAFFTGSFTTRLGEGGLAIDARYCGLDNFRTLRDELAPGGPIDKVHFATLVVTSLIFAALYRVTKKSDRGGTLERAASTGLLVILGLAIAVAFFGTFGGPASTGKPLLRASWNTLVLLVAVPLQMAASLALAMLLNRKIRGVVVYRTLLFLPSIASGIALFLVWRWIFNADFGLLNGVFGPVLDILGGAFHYPALSHKTDWLGTRELAKPALVIMAVWTGMGGTNMVLYLAGLQGIDPTLYEAAEIDGADAWNTFWHVTWPELRPTTFFILTTNLIGGFQIFDQVYIMTGGGPEGSTTTILYHIYTNMCVFEGKLGYAAAISLYLFAIVFGVTLVNYFGSRGGAGGAVVKRTSPAGQLTTYVVLTLIALSTAVPFIWMLSTSLKPEGAVFKAEVELIPRETVHEATLDGKTVRVRPLASPEHPHRAKVLDEKGAHVADVADVRTVSHVAPRFENYPEAWRAYPFVSFWRAYVNTLVVAGLVTIGQVITCALAAYAFARLRFPGRDILFFGYLATMMIPGAVTMIPTFALLKNLPLLLDRLFATDFFGRELVFGGRVVGIDSYFALIAPRCFSAYGTFMLRQFFLGIPKELEEAATIDGCGSLGVFRHVVLPLSTPAIATLAIFTFMWAWGDFLWPLIVTNSDEIKTLPLLLQSFLGQHSSRWNYLMAASTTALLPMLVVFLAGQRYFIEGIKLGAVKG